MVKLAATNYEHGLAIVAVRTYAIVAAITSSAVHKFIVSGMARRETVVVGMVGDAVRQLAIFVVMGSDSVASFRISKFTAHKLAKLSIVGKDARSSRKLEYSVVTFEPVSSVD